MVYEAEPEVILVSIKTDAKMLLNQILWKGIMFLVSKVVPPFPVLVKRFDTSISPVIKVHPNTVMIIHYDSLCYPVEEYS